MFNPAMILQMKNSWETFKSNHPKFPKFMEAVSRTGITEGTIIEVTIKSPDGQDMSTNIKVTQSDLQLFETLKDMR